MTLPFVVTTAREQSGFRTYFIGQFSVGTCSTVNFQSTLLPVLSYLFIVIWAHFIIEKYSLMTLGYPLMGRVTIKIALGQDAIFY